MIQTESQVHIAVKGWYEKPEFENRFSIDWPFSTLPSIGHYVDIRDFLIDPDPRISETYRVDMVQWTSDGPYIVLVPIK